MGVDCWNKLTIRGPIDMLNELEQTKLRLEDLSGVLDFINTTYFGVENVEVQMRTDRCLTVSYRSRNGSFLDFLNLLLLKYWKCWMKNEMIGEDGKAQVWIASILDGLVSSQTVEWQELSLEEAEHRDDFCVGWPE
jgi:hypothetical protein